VRLSLNDAINNAQDGVSVVIAPSTDVVLTSALVIPANKDVTLTSSGSDVDFFKLIGANGTSTIVVMDDAVVNLERVSMTV
jgi:hypothetical protein